MTKISAKVIADSKSPKGHRLTTVVVTFPRFILAELNTHRMMSRNSASSRAIPFEKMLESVENNPFIPIAWQKNHKGMQGTEYYYTPHQIEELNTTWENAKDTAILSAKLLSNGVWDNENNEYMDVTKQLANRLLEPFMYHTVIITASEWENFFTLRCPKYVITSPATSSGNLSRIFRSKKDVLKDHPDIGLELSDSRWFLINKGQAEIHMMELAEQIWDAMNESTPKELKAGEWHVPGITVVED